MLEVTIPAEADPGPAAPTDHDWISVHVFYAGRLEPLLVDCVGPLVRSLRQRGLVERYFFIRYWLEGPHLRLRLLPAPGVAAAAVTAEAEADLDAFLARRPALYDLDRAGLVERYRRMFIAEYGEQRWLSTHGATGDVPIRDNNTYHYIRYEREYDRYAGPAGVELAEWHFEVSSDVVLRLLATTNAHVRSILLGQSVQLMLVLCLELLGDDHRVARFLARYRDHWELAYGEDVVAGHAGYDRLYRRMADRLFRRVQAIRASMRDTPGPDGQPTLLERQWIAHCRQLRRRLRVLGPAPDPGTALLPKLLSSYVHMTNNRLGVSVLEEAYLAHVVRSALLDGARDGGGKR
jgi:thiopeptide-type bacteriocin biosynthesis protein